LMLCVHLCLPLLGDTSTAADRADGRMPSELQRAVRPIAKANLPATLLSNLH
jgi:hypothetical protein